MANYNGRRDWRPKGTTESEDDGTGETSYLPAGVPRDTRYDQADARGPARTRRAITDSMSATDLNILSKCGTHGSLDLHQSYHGVGDFP